MPCTATVTGAGGLSQSLTVSYTNNTNAGTATASASFSGDGNHTGNNGSATFTISLAPSTVTVTCSPTSLQYTGSALTPCTAAVTGTGGLSQSLTVSYTNNTNAGTANAGASFSGDTNHSGRQRLGDLRDCESVLDGSRDLPDKQPDLYRLGPDALHGTGDRGGRFEPIADARKLQQ